MAAHRDIRSRDPKRITETRDSKMQNVVGSQPVDYREARTPNLLPGELPLRNNSQRISGIQGDVSDYGDSSCNRDDGAGWFHSKIQIEQSIKWANNYKIQFFMFLLFAAGIIVSILLYDVNSVSVGLIAGSGLTIIACAAVIYSYIKRPSWRKHPNPLIFYRSVCDFSFVIVLLVVELVSINKSDSNQCKAAAGITQFFLFASESWFFVMSIDMLKSLNSPFTDYKRNVKIYQCFVWAIALGTAIILVSIPDASGKSEFDYCWTSASHSNSSSIDFWKLNVRSWLFFYVWLLIYWAYAIGVIIFAWKRLRAGLAETLRMRLRVLHSVTLYVIAIIIYWGLCFCVYSPYLILNIPNSCFKSDGVDNSNSDCHYGWLKQLMLFMITCKGYFVFFVWFQINELTFSDGLFNTQGETQTDVDIDVDLNPQVNLALRCEVLYYTTSGIIQAVKDTNHLPPGATQQELYLQPQGVEEYVASSDRSLNDDKGNKKNGTLFIDYCPHTFRTIREHFGINTSKYIESLSKTTKERLSEGASGAFMFFSHDQQLIVKSMSSEEANFLRLIAADYAAFLLNNPDSLLTRFYGCHAIKLYGSTFYFVVMANLFSTDQVIHRRYDIKGSWVNRSAKHPSNGKRVTCRHCNGSYIFGSNDAEMMNCPNRVGKHEPNTVLKDNDLTTKVRLDNSTSEELYQQLVKDTNFLSRLGIMDYSLLLGVHNVEYVVNDDFETEMEDGRNASKSVNGRSATRSTGYSVHGSSIKEARRIRASQATTCSSTKGTPSLGSNDSAFEGLPRLFTGTRKANTVVGPSCYYFGLIDILQTWNLSKQSERFFKVYCLGKDGDGVSAVPPIVYKDRFQRTMGELLGIALHNEAFDARHDSDVLLERAIEPLRENSRSL